MPYIRRLTFVDFCDIIDRVPYIAEDWIYNYVCEGFFPEGRAWKSYWAGNRVMKRRSLPRPNKPCERYLSIEPALLWETLRYHDLVNAHFYGGNLEARAIAAGFQPEGAKLKLRK